MLVAARRRGSELHIQIRDNGIGIRDATLPRIFEAFQRDGGTRTEGLGLGLFIVKRAADLLGHRVEVRSTEGRGSCFAVVTDGVWRVANSFQSPQRRNADLRERKAENSYDQ